MNQHLLRLRRTAIGIIVIVVSLHCKLGEGSLVSADPDEFPGAILDHAFDGITLTAIGPGVILEQTVNSNPDWPQSYGHASTGTYVFGVGTDGGDTSESNRYLRVDFDIPTDFVSIDMVGLDTQGTTGILRAFNTAGTQIGSYTTTTTGKNVVEVASVSRPQDDIAYITAGGIWGNGRLLDNLQYDLSVPVPEPSTFILGGLGLLGLALICRKRRI